MLVVMMGDNIGIPGAPILQPDCGPRGPWRLFGKLHGDVKRAQIAALHLGRLYIQINSQKGPAPDGNLWGWLLPEHKKAGQDEPILGEWFLPQGKGLKATHGDKQS